MNKRELPEGWFSDEDIITYRELVSNIPVGGSMLELGSWKGRSICSVADILIEKDIKVSVVDTFKGTESEGDAHKEAKEIDLKEIFLKNVADFGLKDRVFTFAMTTDEAVAGFNDSEFDLIFIDADHTAEAVTKDINNYRPKLKSDGILAGHDWAWGSVREAIYGTKTEVIAFGNVWYSGKLKRNPKFSICFIGRNEAKVLPRAFESLKDFKARGGEICYLDTGSSDNSAQIARDFGCKVEEVGDMFVTKIAEEQAKKINEHFVVEGEAPVVKEGDRIFRFGDARNYCAEKLATNDMVSWMDCDEAFTKLDIEGIENLIAQGYDQFEYNFVFSHDQFGREAIKFIQSKFYNKKKIHWVGIIHEVISGAGNRTVLNEALLKLEHWQNHETDRSGYLRGLALDCWLHPESDRNSHYFAREMMWTGRPRSAIKEFKRHVTMNGWLAEKAQSMVFLGDCYRAIGMDDEALAWYHKAFTTDAWRREPLLRLAQYYYEKNDHMRVVCYATAALQIQKNDFYANNQEDYTNKPHEYLYVALWYLGRREESRYHWKKAIEFCPDHPKYRSDSQFYPESDLEAKQTELCKLAQFYRSDKVPALNHHYTPFYHWLMGPRRNQAKKILEIGIGFPETMPVKDYKAGASLFMWRDYFPNADIYGLDIREDLLINEGRIHSFKCDQSQSGELVALAEKLGREFDFIIDDGSHKTDHQIISAIALIPYVAKGGAYVIEDVQEPEKIVEALSKFGYRCEVQTFNKQAVDDRLVIIYR